MNIDWKRKLTSRKFWTSVVAFITTLVLAFGFNDNDAIKISGIVMAGATVIAYTVGEGLSDSAHEDKE